MPNVTDQRNRLINDIDLSNISYETDRNVIIQYLYLLDRTFFLNDMPIDIINYEKLIYIELLFSDDILIQNLLANIKNTIANNYINKQKFINRITDDLIPNYLQNNFNYTYAIYSRGMMLQKDEILND